MDKKDSYVFQELLKCPRCGQKSLHCTKKGNMLYYQCGNDHCRRAWSRMVVNEGQGTGGFCAFLGFCLMILVLAVLAT